MQPPDMQERWSAVGADPAGATPAEFKARFNVELEKWAKVVKTARIAID